ncbi:unnamed protein product [Moneuplotes crassus]|uniref:Uncharacterized protein n=1 Tax=Euplotes crassus TaxID=5936 RepID=A0AAD1UGT5_EUPCR|nr:unnamed protein product [Moneuplotes crassus]
MFAKASTFKRSSMMLTMFNKRPFMRVSRDLRSPKHVSPALRLTQYQKMNFRPTNTLYSKDYYKILGVPKNASQADIKKKYFQGAKKLHPDVNKASNSQEKFAEFNEAYETLSDENKRRIYDQTGMTGDEQNQAGAGGPFGGGFPGGFGGDAGGFWEQFTGGAHGRQGGMPGGGMPGGMPGGGFEDIFGNFEDLFGMGGRGKSQGPIKGQDVVINISIDFMEAVEGVNKSVRYQKIDNCSRCNGTGAQPGTAETNCSTCGGSGFQTIRQGSMIFQTHCGSCGGAGKVIKNPCLNCQGQGVVQTSSTETIKIPKGVSTGVNLRMSGKGNKGPQGPAGDLMIKITVKDHPYFKRDKFDIHTDKHITVSEAILGGETTVKTLTGDMKLKINPGTQHNDRKRLVRCGISKLPPNHRQKGDHYVNFKIEIPQNLTAEQRELMEKYAKVESQLSIS